MEKAKERKYYVYLLMDPTKTGIESIFYVGKGQAERAKDHLKNISAETAKNKKIAEIRAKNQEVKIEKLRRNLTNQEALEIEAATIDLIGKENLTNLQRGQGSKTKGRSPYEELFTKIERISEKELKKDGVLLVCINNSYSIYSTPQELYNVARGCWGLSTTNGKMTYENKIKYVLAVAYGIVREVYEPVGWFKAGQTQLDSKVPEANKNKWEFVGKIAEDKVREKYKGKAYKFKGQKGFEIYH